MADAMKPLDWRKPTKHDRDQGGRDSAIWIAPGLGGEYAIQSDLKNFILWRVDDPYAFDTFPTVEAAKAHAEADWQQTLSRKLAASPPAREEAPAEGAGEIDGLRNRIKCLEKLAGEQSLRVMQQATRAKDAENELAALRDRTSEPAREASFLGHVVMDAVFIPKGEPIPLMGGRGKVTPVYDGPQNVTATADKLRVAVEALSVAEDELDRVAEEDVTYEPLMTKDALCVVRQALATLNEEG